MRNYVTVSTYAKRESSKFPFSLARPAGLQFAGCLENRIGDRADVRVDALEVTQDVEMERARLYAFRAK
jgi:hypothetical protein